MEKVYEESPNPEEDIEKNPLRDRLEKFDETFKRWVSYLSELELMQCGGYRFEKDDLTKLEWQALGIIKNWRQHHVKAQSLGTLDDPVEQGNY